MYSLQITRGIVTYLLFGPSDSHPYNPSQSHFSERSSWWTYFSKIFLVIFIFSYLEWNFHFFCMLPSSSWNFIYHFPTIKRVSFIPKKFVPHNSSSFASSSSANSLPLMLRLTPWIHWSLDLPCPSCSLNSTPVSVFICCFFSSFWNMQMTSRKS